MSGVSKSEVSRVCEEIDERVQAFLHRPLEGRYPYVWIDATYVKVHREGRVSTVAAIVAIGVNEHGRREVLGLEVGPSEAAPFWTEFLRGLVRRGLRGVELVISDAHEGIKAGSPGCSGPPGSAAGCTSVARCSSVPRRAAGG
jgi:transposase-like protein